MDRKIKYIIFLTLIKIYLSFVPNWNFENSAIKLELPHKYYIVDRDLHGAYFKLYRQIYFNNNYNNITESNTLYLSDQDYGITEYDDIESAYKYNQYTIICPKGRFHPIRFDSNKGEFMSLKPNGFSYDGDWDLKCYYHFYEHFLFISYLNSDNSLYKYDLNQLGFNNNIKFHKGIYGFKWKTSNEEGSSNERQMIAIINNDNKFYLKSLYITIQSGDFYSQEKKSKELAKLKSKSLGFFRNDDNFFTFITYNETNASDYISGYYNKNENLNTKDFNYLEFELNENSPFEFLENVTINKIKYIYDTQYVYYNLSINNSTKFYYGVIDITMNKIIFNTNEDLLVFKPYSNNAMLAITKSSAYKICIIREKGTENCLNTCENNDLILNSITYNSCDKNCETNIFLMPNNICINSCDTNLFILHDNKECWLCKDMNNGVNKYKYINSNQCLEKMPNNSYYVNKQFYVIDCIEGYYFSNNTCIKCHDNCKKCIEASNNDADQKCISCKKEYFLENENCIDNCSSGFYSEEKNCKKCSDKCKTCNINGNNCTSCDSGKYLDNNSCEICSEICGNCSDFNTCITCNKTSNFTYLYNNTCLSDCPENTTIETVGNNQICIAKSDNNENKNEKGNLDKKVKTMQFIFIIVTGLLLFIIIICFCKSICCKSKNNKENLINEINTELIDNDGIIN